MGITLYAMQRLLLSFSAGLLFSTACGPDESLLPEVLGEESSAVPLFDEINAVQLFGRNRLTPPRATDLAFHPTRTGELWVTLRHDDDGVPCTSNSIRGCSDTPGSIVLFEDARAAVPTFQILRDQNAQHFMRRPPAIAFGDDDYFATCGEARTANSEDADTDFIGPTLWSAARDVFAVSPSPGGNGSHLDMLHGTPYCMGMAHLDGNRYFAFNGQAGAIDLYNFAQPHEPGGMDHSDGSLRRYMDGELLRSTDIPSHLDYHAGSSTLYIVDTGHSRILRLFVDSGRLGDAIRTPDGIADARFVVTADWDVLVPPGELSRPSGIALGSDVFYVTDNTFGLIYQYDLSGQLLAQFDTGLGPNALAGIALGPDDKLYWVDMVNGAVWRGDSP